MLIFFAAEAVLNEANVEPYLPSGWTEQETEVLSHLVGVYGPANWNIIAAGVNSKSETQVRLCRIIYSRDHISSYAFTLLLAISNEETRTKYENKIRIQIDRSARFYLRVTY